MIVIACYRGKSLLSWKIKRETNSPISHVSIIQLPDTVWNPADGVRVNVLCHALATCPVWEAWGRAGVVRHTGIDNGHTPGTMIELFRIQEDVRVPEAEIIRDLDAIVASGTKYDWFGLLRYKLRINRDNAARMFCSELLHYVLRLRSVHLLRRREPSKTAPGDIYISPLLHFLWTVKVSKPARIPQEALPPADAPTPAKNDPAHLQGHTAHLQGHSAPILAASSPQSTGETFFALPLCGANAAPQAANAATLAAPGFTLLQEDGLFVPFGDFPHAVGLQRFDASAANALIAALAANPNGQPIYRGHPDVPGMAEDWPDKDAKGWIHAAAITAHNGRPGCRFTVKYNEDGLEIVRQAKLKFPSPFWKLRVIGKSDDGRRIVAPTELVSIGLVNNPNIPVPAVANAATPQPQPGGQPAKSEENTAMREKLIAMLQAASVEVPENATDEQLVELVKTTLGAAVAAAATATQAGTEASAVAEAQKVNAANSRKIAAEAIVDLAILQGRVSLGKRPDVLKQFETNFAAANANILALDPVLPLCTSKNLGSRQQGLDTANLDAANARKEFLSLVTQEEARLGSVLSASNSAAQAREMAWENIRRSNAALYARAYPAKSKP